MGDTPSDVDDVHKIPPTTTVSVAMTSESSTVPFFEVHQHAATASNADEQIDLEHELVNVWQPLSEPIEPIPGVLATPP